MSNGMKENSYLYFKCLPCSKFKTGMKGKKFSFGNGYTVAVFSQKKITNFILLQKTLF